MVGGGRNLVKRSGVGNLIRRGKLFINREERKKNSKSCFWFVLFLTLDKISFCIFTIFIFLT